jgi:hypothetical protein
MAGVRQAVLFPRSFPQGLAQIRASPSASCAYSWRGASDNGVCEGCAADGWIS